jgi:hypothetical protein
VADFCRGSAELNIGLASERRAAANFWHVDEALSLAIAKYRSEALAALSLWATGNFRHCVFRVTLLNKTI